MPDDEHAAVAPSATEPWSADDLEALGTLVTRLRSEDGAGDRELLVGELETAHEELRVADEELRVQRDTLTELLADRRTAAAQRDWLASLLPVPMVVTDPAGMVLSANVAASGLLNTALATVLTKPLVTFVHPDDRATARSTLSRASVEPVRLELRLAPRRSEPVRAVVAVTASAASPNGRGDVTWTVLAAGERGVPAVPELDALRLASAFAEICRVPPPDEDLHRLLARMAGIALRSVVGATAVSVTIGHPAAPTHVATTDQAAAAADGLQIQVAEGPCVQAFADRAPVTSADLRTDPRWPALAGRVASTGVVSAVAAPIEVDDELVGALNVYGTSVGVFDEVPSRAVALLAVAIGSILRGVRDQQQLRDLVGQLNAALESRAVIDQAKGIIMARHGGTADEAFTRLAALSQHRNVKLRELARSIVEQVSTGTPSGAASSDRRRR